jgi:glutamyl/glutaminyl-tRNA synthetase
MHITHVMRGDDHLSNTPKQIAVYRALGHEPPTFAHVPMIHGPDGKKLSKRHGATAVGDYRNEGILPGAMRNFLTLLGWNPGDEREVFADLQELIDTFSLERIQKKAAIFDLTKLEWMNGQYIQSTDPEALHDLIVDELAAKNITADAIGRERLLHCIQVNSERARTTLDLAHRVALRYDASLIERTPKATKLIEKDPDGYRAAIEASRMRLETLSDDAWEPERLEAELRVLAEEMDLKVGKIFQPIRVALTGDTVSEGVNVLLEVVGRDESLKRLATAIDG